MGVIRIETGGLPDSAKQIISAIRYGKSQSPKVIGADIFCGRSNTQVVIDTARGMGVHITGAWVYGKNRPINPFNIRDSANIDNNSLPNQGVVFREEPKVTVPQNPEQLFKRNLTLMRDPYKASGLMTALGIFTDALKQQDPTFSDLHPWHLVEFNESVVSEKQITKPSFTILEGISPELTCEILQYANNFAAYHKSKLHALRQLLDRSENSFLETVSVVIENQGIVNSLKTLVPQTNI